MRSISIISFFFFLPISGLSLTGQKLQRSNTIVCEIPSSEIPASLEIKLSSDGNFVEAMTHILKNENKDNQASEERKIIYNKKALIRGGFQVDYCNPDQNEYLKFSNKYSIWAQCKSQNFSQQVLFEAEFSLNKTGGIVSYMENDGSYTDLGFNYCK